jgi:hypothetical protein
VDSSWQMLEKYSRHSPEYVRKAAALVEKYHPIELDHTLTNEQKTPHIVQWFTQEKGAHKKIVWFTQEMGVTQKTIWFTQEKGAHKTIWFTQENWAHKTIWFTQENGAQKTIWFSGRGGTKTIPVWFMQVEEEAQNTRHKA